MPNFKAKKNKKYFCGILLWHVAETAVSLTSGLRAEKQDSL
jgi:hypothetical protein